MNLLIKRFIQTPAGEEADGQRLCTGNTLSIGANSDQDIVIDWPNVQLRHAEIKEQNGQLQLLSQTQKGIQLNKHWTQQATLKHGDKITLGNNTLVLEKQQDQWLVNVYVNETQAKPSTAKFQTRLTQTRFSKRRWSWMLLLSISALFVIAPLLQQQLTKQTTATAAPDWQQYIPDHSSWNTGSFHPAHQYFAQDCQSCHELPFTQVKNNACMDCHESIATHAPADKFPQAELQEAACQSCHKEHNGKAELVMDDQKLCVGCHQDIQNFSQGASTQENVHDWQRSHPEITLNIPAWDTVGNDWAWQQVKASNAIQGTAKEQSGLKFPHELHLRPEGFDSETGITEILECQSCHTPEPGGALMKPIVMEQDCGRCHTLDLDERFPEVSVRHGDVPAVLRDIIGLKGLDQLIPESEKIQPDNTLPRSTLLRPGKNPNAQYQRQAQTLVAAAESLIEKRSCITCHDVSRDEEALKRSDLFDIWHIAPVMITPRWIDDAEFDHSSHNSVQCDSCHSQAAVSEDASDIMMPDRQVCMDCHGNPGADGLTSSQCVDCHSYHLPQHGWLAAPAESNPQTPQTP